MEMEELVTSPCDCSIIPKHLHRNSRPCKEKFEPKEKLFCRFPLKDATGDPNIIEEEGYKVLSRNFFSSRQFDAKMSCNREICCFSGEDSPMDVLFDGVHCIHKKDDGIIQFIVEEVEAKKFKHPIEDWEYKLKVVHDPIPCMYPHCEIRTFKEDMFSTPTAKIIKEEIKAHYQTIALIIHPQEDK